MVKEKISRKQLLKEPDQILTTSVRALRFIQQNMRVITVGVAGVVVVGLVVWGWSVYRDRREMQAQELQAQAYQLFRKAVEQADAKTSRELLAKSMERFREVIDEFDGTRASNMARIYRGHASYTLERYDDAVENYRSALKRISSPGMKALGLQGLAYSYLTKGDTEKAVETFDRLRNTGGEAFSGTVEWGVAQCYERQGKLEEAVDLYRRLKESSANRVRRMLAEAKVAELTRK